MKLNLNTTSTRVKGAAARQVLKAVRSGRTVSTPQARAFAASLRAQLAATRQAASRAK